MPSPIGQNAPLCSAKSKRARRRCRNRAMANGKCRMHGGTNPGPPKGNTNALTHGIYSSAIRADERDIWERIPVGGLDDELKVARLQLKRALEALNAAERDGGDEPDGVALPGEDVAALQRAIAAHQALNAATIERHRLHVFRLMGRIGHLESWRGQLLKAGIESGRELATISAEPLPQDGDEWLKAHAPSSKSPG